MHLLRNRGRLAMTDVLSGACRRPDSSRPPSSRVSSRPGTARSGRLSASGGLLRLDPARPHSGGSSRGPR